MKNSAFLVGVLAMGLAFSACGDVPTKSDRSRRVTTCPSSTCVPVSVAIAGGIIRVPDDTYTYANHTKIVWTIITPGTYTFPDKGIAFQTAGVFICDPHGGTKTFTCRKNGNPLGKYKYTVNVNAGSNPLAPVPLNALDPWILNQ